MKLRCFISLIIVMVMATSTAGAVEVYNRDGNTLNLFGNIVGGQYFSNNPDSKGIQSFMKYGLISETYINGIVSGFGMWEGEISLQEVEGGMHLKDNNYSTLGYAGIRVKDFGSIDYGRNYGVLYDVESWVDIVSVFGGELCIPDNFLSGRASNLITYRNDSLFGFLDGFNFAIQYQSQNDVDQFSGRSVKTSNGEGYGVSASYQLKSGLAASAAYSNSKRTLNQKNLDTTYGVSDNSNAEAYFVGLKYDAYGVYVAAIYGETYSITPFGNFDDVLNTESIYGFVNKARNLGMVAQYKFNCGLTPTVSYLHLKASDLENGYANYLKKFVTIGTSYAFNKNMSTSVDYKINLLHKSDFTTISKIDTDNIIALGISYLF